MTYVELKRYKQHDNQWTCQNGATSKLTLDEIAQELNMSESNLTHNKRALLNGNTPKFSQAKIRFS